MIKHVPTADAKAIVFDIDGVLINSAQSILMQAEYWLLQIRNRGMNGDDLARARRIFSKTGDPHASLREVLQCDDDEWTENESRYIKVHKDGFRLFKSEMTMYPGAVQLVVDLLATKKVAAFTTRERSFFTSAVCPELIPPPKAGQSEYPHGHFHITITADDVSRLKPHPEGLYKIANEFKVKPHEMIMVGDSPTDIIAAKNAGAVAVAMAHPDSFASRSLLKDAKPDYMISTFDELRQLILPNRT